MIILDNQVSKVHLNESLQVIHIEWKMYAKKENFKLALNKALDSLFDYKFNKMILDLRKLGSISKKDNNWLVSEWVTLAKENGLSYLAIIYDDNILGQNELLQFINISQNNININSFLDYESSVNWINNI